MRLFFRVHENRIFIMSDFRDFFHAQHRISSFCIDSPILELVGIEMRELLIFKGRHETARFPTKQAPFLNVLAYFLPIFSDEILPKSQNLSAGSLYWYPRT